MVWPSDQYLKSQYLDNGLTYGDDFGIQMLSELTRTDAWVTIKCAVPLSISNSYIYNTLCTQVKNIWENISKSTSDMSGKSHDRLVYT